MDEESRKAILRKVNELQLLRGDVPTFVLGSGINMVTVMEVRLALHKVPKGDEVDIILHSPGGDPHDAYRLIRTFRERYTTVNVIVPLWAKSAATIFAFGGSRIVLHEFGELGPLDAQIRKTEDGVDSGFSSALNVQSSLQEIENRARVGVIEMMSTISSSPDIKIGRTQLLEMVLQHSSKFYEPLMQKIDAVEIGSMARYLDVGRLYAKRILTEYTDLDEPQLTELLDFLVYGSPDHGYVVDYGLLHPFLDNVVHASDAPFGDKYYAVLDELSLLLMYQNTDIVGFSNTLNKINKHLKTDKIDAGTKEDTNEGDSTAGTPGDVTPAVAQPDQNGGKNRRTTGKRPVGRPKKVVDSKSDPVTPSPAK